MKVVKDWQVEVMSTEINMELLKNQEDMLLIKQGMEVKRTTDPVQMKESPTTAIEARLIIAKV